MCQKFFSFLILTFLYHFSQDTKSTSQNKEKGPAPNLDGVSFPFPPQFMLSLLVIL